MIFVLLILVGFLWLIVKAASVSGIESEIKLLRSRVDSLAKDLSELRRENKALRGELVAGGSLPEGWAPAPPVETAEAAPLKPGMLPPKTGPMVTGDDADSLLAFRVRRALLDLEDAKAYVHNIRVDVLRGRATMEGSVPSVGDSHVVERAVSGALGITSVVNLLEIGLPSKLMAAVQATEQVAEQAAMAVTRGPAAPQAADAPPPDAIAEIAKAAAPAGRRPRPKPLGRPAVNWARAWATIAGPLSGATQAGGGRRAGQQDTGAGTAGEAAGEVSRAEAAVGTVWLSRAGVILLIIGAIFAYRYGVTNDSLRVAIGYAAGLAVLGLGRWGHQRQYRIWSQAMTGGGVAILYLTTTAGTALFAQPVMPYAVGFALMVLTTVLATGLAVTYDSVVVGLFGLIGGFATPFLLSTAPGGAGGFGGLFAYIAVLDAGLLLVAYFRRWPLYNYLVFAATWGIFGMWRLSRYNFSQAATGMWAASAYHLIFALVSIAYTVMRRKKGNPADLALATLNGFAYFASGLDLLVSQTALTRGAFALGLAGFYVVLGALNYRLNRKDRLMTMALVGLAWVFGTAAAPVALNGSWVTVAWAVEGAALMWLAMRVPVGGLDLAGLVVLGLAGLRLVSVESFPATFGLPLAGPGLRAVTFGVAVASAYAAAWAAGRAGSGTRFGLGAAGCFFTVWYMTREVLLYYRPGQIGQVASIVTALAGMWGLYGLLLAAADMRLRHGLVRVGARLVLAGTVLFAAAAPLAVRAGELWMPAVRVPYTAAPDWLVYAGAGVGLLAVWVAEYSFRRRGVKDGRMTGLLSLVAAVAGYWVFGAFVAREARLGFSAPHSRPVIGLLGVQMASYVAYVVAACLGVYSSVVMAASRWLGSHSGRNLASALMLATMGWAAVAAVPAPAASAGLRAVAYVLVMQMAVLAVARPGARADGSGTRGQGDGAGGGDRAGSAGSVGSAGRSQLHWPLTAVAVGAVLLTAWWGAVEVLFAFARSAGASLPVILTGRGGTVGAEMATGSGAYGLAAWLGAYALAVRLAGVKLQCAYTRWAGLVVQGVGLIVLLGVVVFRGGAWAWQGAAFAAAVVGAYVSDWLMGGRGPAERAATRLASLVACGITLVWMAFSVVREYEFALSGPFDGWMAEYSARNHWILIVAAAYGLVVLLAGLRLRAGDFRAMGLGMLALSVAGLFSAGILAPQAGHGLRLAAYAATVGGLYAATWLVRRYGQVSTQRERAVSGWASLAAAAGTVAWLAVQVSQFFAPALTAGTEAQRAYAQTTMDFGVSAAWGVYGLLVLVAGFALRHRWTRVLGLGIFVLTLGKIVASDMWQLAFRWRIWITVGVGAIFVAASLLYQRYIKLILAEDDG